MMMMMLIGRQQHQRRVLVSHHQLNNHLIIIVSGKRRFQHHYDDGSPPTLTTRTVHRHRLLPSSKISTTTTTTAAAAAARTLVKRTIIWGAKGHEISRDSVHPRHPLSQSSLSLSRLERIPTTWHAKRWLYNKSSSVLLAKAVVPALDDSSLLVVADDVSDNNPRTILESCWNHLTESSCSSSCSSSSSSNTNDNNKVDDDVLALAFSSIDRLVQHRQQQQQLPTIMLPTICSNNNNNFSLHDKHDSVMPLNQQSSFEYHLVYRLLKAWRDHLIYHRDDDGIDRDPASSSSSSSSCSSNNNNNNNNNNNSSHPRSIFTPRFVFEQIKKWQSHLQQQLQPQAEDPFYCLARCYHLVLHTATFVSLDPDLADDIVRYYLLGMMRRKLDDTTIADASTSTLTMATMDALHPPYAKTVDSNNFDDDEDDNVPDVSLADVLQCWASASNSGRRVDAPERAEALLRHVSSWYESTSSSDSVHPDNDTTTNNNSSLSLLAKKPDVSSYNAVLSAWSCSSQPHAADRAQALYEEMTRKSIDDITVKPNATTYTLVLTAWGVQASQRTSTWKEKTTATINAQSVFDDMMTHHNMSSSSQDANAANNKVLIPIYTALMHVWAQVGDAERVESMLRKILVMEQSSFKLLSSSSSSSSSPSSNSSNAFQSNFVKAFNATLDAWAHSNDPQAPQRAQALWDELIMIPKSTSSLAEGEDGGGGEEGYHQHIHPWKPNRHSFRHFMTIWGRTKSVQGATKVQQIFQELLRQYHQSDDDNDDHNVELRPTAEEYCALLDAWAEAREQPQRAERVLRDMIAYQLLELPSVTATTCYTTVMKAWSRSGLVFAAERTQALYDELIKIINNNNSNKNDNVDNHKEEVALDPAIKPTVDTYEALITAWGRSVNKEGAHKAQAFFDTLMAEYQQQASSTDNHDNVDNNDHINNLKPTVVTFNALMDAWSKAGEPERSESILRSMMVAVDDAQASGGGSLIDIQPNAASYNTVMFAWSRSDRPDAAERVQALYEEMVRLSKSKVTKKRGEKDLYHGGYSIDNFASNRSLQPTSITYYAVISTWCKSNRRHAKIKAKAALSDMMTRYRAGESSFKPEIEKLRAMIKKKSTSFSKER